MNQVQAHRAAGQSRAYRLCKGMSLVEIVIAMAIFAAFLVVVVQSMLSLRGLTDFSQRQDDLERESRRILQTLSDDLTNSAWFYKPDVNTVTGVTTMVPVYPLVAKSIDPLASFGDTLEFVKLRTERSVAATPATLRTEHVNFADTLIKPVAMADYWQGPAVRSLVLNEDFGKALNTGDAAYPYRNTFVAAVWESDRSNLTFLENADETNLRRYRYVVTTNALTGTGTLVRQYKNASEAVYSGEETIAENVFELKFDSSATWKTLNRNQLHVSFILERPAQPGTARVRRKVDATIAMRSITNEATN